MADKKEEAEYGREIQERLLAGDPVAPSDLALRYLDLLARRLRRRFAAVPDADLIYDAAVDAILSYIQHPSRFDPERGTLLSYLTMSAQGDLLNTLAKQRRRASRHVRLETVEHSLVVRNREEERNNVDGRMLLATAWEAVPGEDDRHLLHLMLAGERRTNVFAAVLGLHNGTEAEKRRIVKRHKDRLKKRLQRLRISLSEEDNP